MGRTKSAAIKSYIHTYYHYATNVLFFRPDTYFPIE